MADLSAVSWNAMTTRVADRLIIVINNLVDKTMAAGYPPFTVPPPPDMRYMLYIQRPLEEWHGMAKTDPQAALDEVRDFANMARRRGEPEVAVPAARAVLSETAVEDSYGRRE
jgi:hypothetical protein